MVASAVAMFGGDADHTAMARVAERLAGEELGSDPSPGPSRKGRGEAQ